MIFKAGRKEDGTVGFVLQIDEVELSVITSSLMSTQDLLKEMEHYKLPEEAKYLRNSLHQLIEEFRKEIKSHTGTDIVEQHNKNLYVNKEL